MRGFGWGMRIRGGGLGCRGVGGWWVGVVYFGDLICGRSIRGNEVMMLFGRIG